MSALSVLYIVLPFPLAFIINDLEEMVVQHRWMLSHRYILEERFPRIKPISKHLASLDTKSFAIAALEELFIIILVTCYVLIQGKYCMEIWSALFIAFSFHQLIHIIQATILHSYVPGVFTSLLLLPYSYIGLQSIWNAMNGTGVMLCGIVGIIFMVLNLLFAHWIGKTCSKYLFCNFYSRQ